MLLNLFGLLDLLLDSEKLLLQGLLLPDGLCQLLYRLLEFALVHQPCQGFLAHVLDWSSRLHTMDVVCLQAGCETRLARGSICKLRSDLLDLLLTLLLHLVHLGSVLLSQVNYCAVHLLDLSLELAFVLCYALAGSYSTSNHISSVAVCFRWLLKCLWQATDDHGARLLLLVPYALDGMQLLMGVSD